MSPTPRTVALAALVALSAFVLPAEVAGLLLAALLAAVVADAAAVRRPPEVVRTIPAEVVRGVPAPFSLAATGTGGGRRIEVRQPQTAEVRLTPAEGADAIAGTLVASVRGDHELPPAVTRRTGPLGLARWTHVHGGSVVVSSHADLPGARRIARAVQEGRFADPGLRRGALGLGTDFESVREYAPDDDIRRMNWKATERVGHPMVNQYREDTERELWCLVDGGRLLSAPVGDRTRLDAALDAVAAVAAVAEVVGDRVGAVVFDDEVRQVVPPRRGGAADLVRLLDPLQPTLADADHEAAFARLGAAKRSLVVVFTDLLDLAASRPLLDAVPVLVRRHAVVIAGVADPDLLAAVTTTPRTAADLARASVARDLLDERRIVDARLTAAGALVVDAPVERFPSACVAAYLQLKSLARL